ncbi:MAG TPA: hypothetical protein V6D48_09240 [Oculatellaceae cyanobacterium]
MPSSKGDGILQLSDASHNLTALLPSAFHRRNTAAKSCLLLVIGYWLFDA